LRLSFARESRLTNPCRGRHGLLLALDRICDHSAISLSEEFVMKLMIASIFSLMMLSAATANADTMDGSAMASGAYGHHHHHHHCWRHAHHRVCRR
jgi:hypothetical protein